MMRALEESPPRARVGAGEWCQAHAGDVVEVDELRGPARTLGLYVRIRLDGRELAIIELTARGELDDICGHDFTEPPPHVNLHEEGE